MKHLRKYALWSPVNTEQAQARLERITQPTYDAVEIPLLKGPFRPLLVGMCGYRAMFKSWVRFVWKGRIHFVLSDIKDLWVWYKHQRRNA